MIEVKPYEDIKYTRRENGHVHPPESIRLQRGSILEVVETFGSGFSTSGSYICIAEIKKSKMDGRAIKNLPTTPSAIRQEPIMQSEHDKNRG